MLVTERPSGRTATEPFWKAHYVPLFAAACTFAGLVLAPHYLHNLYPDTISYLSIAQKYVDGDLANAVNAYWSPLLCWAMVPFLALGFDPLLSLRLVGILAGTATMLAAGSMFAAFPVPIAIRRLMLLALLPAVVYFSMAMVTPDLLPTALLTAYFAIIFRESYATSPVRGLLCGLLGGVAYLSKQYALPFFVVHFCLMNLWHYRRGAARRIVVVNTAGGLLVCALVALPWIGALNQKYGRLMIGTSGARTYAYVGPESRGDTLGPHGLVAPPNATAVSAWEDPSTDMLESWSPLASSANMRHQAELIVRNAKDISKSVLFFSPLAPLLILGYIVLCIRRAPSPRAWLPLLTSAVYLAGYVFVLIEERYLWPIAVQMMLMAGLLVTALPRTVQLRRRAGQAVLGLCLASFVVMPVLQLARDFDAGSELAELGDVLRERYGVHGNLAAHNEYKSPLYLSFYLGARFFGTSDRRLPEGQIEQALIDHDIDYYFVWTHSRGRDAGAPAFLDDYREITGGELSNVRVYALKDRRLGHLEGGNGGK